MSTFNDGYAAQKRGEPVGNCPCESPDEVGEWVRGWQTAADGWQIVKADREGAETDACGETVEKARVAHGAGRAKSATIWWAGWTRSECGHIGSEWFWTYKAACAFASNLRRMGASVDVFPESVKVLPERLGTAS
ncbi:MAG: hypothetical protein IMZ50_08740 [Candidatus Atribacteria bacterium]|nr:hypothetical protein [Candidatus Atribacteria bacterium]